MIPLILVVCLATGGACHDERTPIMMTPVACQTMGQLAALQWLNDHPKWRLRGWRCEAIPQEKT